MPHDITLVSTTIFDMPALDGYVEAAQRYDGNVRLIVIPDRKTDPALFQRVARLQASIDGRSVRLACPTLAEQAAFLASLGLGSDFIPENSDNRRNVGFLMALAERPDVLVSVDDDNFVLDPSAYFAEHTVVGHRQYGAMTAHAPSGWINICDMLAYPSGQRLFPRGLPYAKRLQGESACATAGLPSRALAGVDYGQADCDVHINAGLWLKDPDVDAVSRLAGIVHTTAQRGESVVLSPSTWTPINTQNTALRGDAIAAYYYVRMGEKLGGFPLDRFGDILSGYFVQACAKALGGQVRVGSPLVEHDRTPHDLLKDLSQEMGGILMLEDLALWLVEQKLTGATYAETYADLADRLEAQADHFVGTVWDAGARDFLRRTAGRMRTWLKACAVLAGRDGVSGLRAA